MIDQHRGAVKGRCHRGREGKPAAPLAGKSIKSASGVHSQVEKPVRASKRGKSQVPNRLTLDSVGKSYGPVIALRGISFAVRPGEVHALIGENGAGKSTLVKLITGMERPDEGELLLDDRPVSFSTPIDARMAGITAVYQDPKLFPQLDVAENIFMGIYPRGFLGLVDKKRMYAEAGRLLAALGASIDPRDLLMGLSVADVQFIEIVRAMCADLRLLVLDEATASFTPSESERLFTILHALVAKGVSVLFISHRLHEVLHIADRITVLRDGELVSTDPASELTEAELVRRMVGRELSSGASRVDAPIGERPALEVRGLSLPGFFENVSFTVREGEIVGLAGLVGSGRTEIAEAIFGIRQPSSGRVAVGGEEVRSGSPEEMVGRGVAFIPEDRDANGIIADMGVGPNISLTALDRIAPSGLISRASESDFAGAFAEDFEIKAESLDAPVSRLSGGNRQKVVLAKWLATAPKVLILDEPTRGIDVGTKAQIHQRISELASAGFPVLLISSDLPELLAMCDRILVVAGGRIAAEFARVEATQEKIMKAASGGNQGRGKGLELLNKE
jgi:rhamnose transport system ATP-binding protein